MKQNQQGDGEMPICGRCGGNLTPNVDGYFCGSTGNLDNPNEILWYHKICPNRKPIEKCETGHDKYRGTCVCDQSDKCDKCGYCKACEQFILFSGTMKQSFLCVGQAMSQGEIK